ncbi:CRTAC1 family protein [uncultured Formosa sp.]|uniref:CRTAC1 family protein n=1 Tax=uncultured Formosa sp. TaxID=255435 RepID=UPI0026148C84|nr:CRTAC1 family protein [uncultured Formosa sp.]
MSKVKKILGGVLALIVLIIISVAVKFSTDRNNPYKNTIAESLIPTFKEIPIDFTHQFNGTESLPVTASVLIDIDNDGVDELFLGGGYNQQDEIFSYKAGKFVSISKSVGLPIKEHSTTLSGASTDLDNNGFTDLILSREDGIVIYYNTNGKFTPKILEYDLADNATPLGLTLGDVNKDGFTDIFVANYIRKKQMVGQNNFSENYGPQSLLLINNGDHTFKNTTIEAGLEYLHNTFMGILIDIDNDTWLDLVIAYDTGEIRTYKNKGDGTFEKKENPSTNTFGYPMGIAVGDYNNDGLVDFMFSNTGSTVPHFLASGNIEDKSLFNSDWIFFENKGHFVFEDVAEKTQIKDFEFSWGAVFADMNNDGLQELIVAENYIDFPPHKVFKLPGRFLVQKEDHTFVSTEEKSGIVNPNYAITPLVSDFNTDGYLDLVWVNIGSPVLAYINKGGKNNFIKVKLDDNAKNLGAKVEVITTGGKKITEDFIVGEGLTSDQSATLHFGLGKDQVQQVVVRYIGGSEYTFLAPKTNTLLTIPKVSDSIPTTNLSQE